MVSFSIHDDRRSLYLVFSSRQVGRPAAPTCRHMVVGDDAGNDAGDDAGDEGRRGGRREG